MEEYARIDKNEIRTVMAISKDRRMKKVRTEKDGKLLTNTVSLNENYTNRDEYALQDDLETPCILGLTKTGKLRKITSLGGRINVAFK